MLQPKQSSIADSRILRATVLQGLIAPKQTLRKNKSTCTHTHTNKQINKQTDADGLQTAASLRQHLPFLRTQKKTATAPPHPRFPASTLKVSGTGVGRQRRIGRYTSASHRLCPKPDKMKQTIIKTNHGCHNIRGVSVSSTSLFRGSLCTPSTAAARKRTEDKEAERDKKKTSPKKTKREENKKRGKGKNKARSKRGPRPSANKANKQHNQTAANTKWGRRKGSRRGPCTDLVDDVDAVDRGDEETLRKRKTQTEVGVSST